jgi:hypothetical protein
VKGKSYVLLPFLAPSLQPGPGDGLLHEPRGDGVDPAGRRTAADPWELERSDHLTSGHRNQASTSRAL